MRRSKICKWPSSSRISISSVPSASHNSSAQEVAKVATKEASSNHANSRNLKSSNAQWLTIKTGMLLNKTEQVVVNPLSLSQINARLPLAIHTEVKDCLKIAIWLKDQIKSLKSNKRKLLMENKR